jgi:hypothetical protein
LSLLYIINPLSLVSASIHMGVHSESTRLVSFEFTYINVSFSMPKCSLSLSFIFDPIAFIDSTICPNLNPVPASFFDSFLLIDHHLPFIHTSIWKNVIWNKN